MLSDCLSPHVDACQIERGPKFIDWVITEVAIEGLDGFRRVSVILGGVDWVLEQLSLMCVPVNILAKSSVFVCPCVHIKTDIQTVRTACALIVWSIRPVFQLIQRLQPLICGHTVSVSYFHLSCCPC